MNLLLKAALSYRKLGYSVIPISPKGEKPLVDWKEYQAAKRFMGAYPEARDTRQRRIA